jgi:hypothetical protein
VLIRLSKEIPMLRASILLSFALIAPAVSTALEVPYLEDFPENERNWRPRDSSQFLDWSETGGPDGGSYATTELSYLDSATPFGSGPVVFRANTDANASGGNFFGNWNNKGVTEFRAWVRHDTGQNLTYFLRVATAANFPGAIIDDDVTVPSGEWTQISWILDRDDPACQGEGVTCTQALANVGVLQIGSDAPGTLNDDPSLYTMDIDKVEVIGVPEPGQALLLANGAICLVVGREIRRRASRTSSKDRNRYHD